MLEDKSNDFEQDVKKNIPPEDCNDGLSFCYIEPDGRTYIDGTWYEPEPLTTPLILHQHQEMLWALQAPARQYRKMLNALDVPAHQHQEMLWALQAPARQHQMMMKTLEASAQQFYKGLASNL